jgi:predicted ribosome quality control (RQC) complex YloA/Tae2 family protein
VRALTLLLREKIVGLRVANVYDVSGRLYLLKLAKGGVKQTLLIESGIRIHTTDFIKNKKDLPSGFSMKLRKHLRTKKLTSIKQLGMDRVIDIQFGRDEFASHLLIELYAQGNVILTDHEYTILSLLRTYTLDGNQGD